MTANSTASDWTRRVPLLLAFAFVGVFVGLPILVMLYETVATPDGFGFSAWGGILSSEVDRSQMVYSLQLGLLSCAVALIFGGGHAWLTQRTDLPGRALLGPLGVAPLAIPPILVAMGFADFSEVSGFWACGGMLGICYAPFVAVLTARGLRSIDGQVWEVASLHRGRGRAERMLLRMVAPEILAGLLFVFVFVLSEHGVPEFLTVKGKTWHTYAEGVFGRWTRRAMGAEFEDLVSPIIAAIPLVLILMLSLGVALRLRAHTPSGKAPKPLPRLSLGVMRWPALLLPLVYLGVGVGVPVVVMLRWTAGSTVVDEPMTFAVLRQSFRLAYTEAGPDLTYTLGIAIAATLLLVAISLPLARLAARRAPWVEWLSLVPIAVPAVLLGIGMVKVFNSPTAGAVYDVTGDFYDSWGIVTCAYAARFLPFGVLTLAHAVRRIPASWGEAADLVPRSPWARMRAVHFPLLLPAAWSASCLAFILALRELDMAVVLPAGNGTVVRRLSNVVHFGGEDMGGALAITLLFGAALGPLLTLLLTGKKLQSLS